VEKVEAGRHWEAFSGATIGAPNAPFISHTCGTPPPGRHRPGGHSRSHLLSFLEDSPSKPGPTWKMIFVSVESTARRLQHRAS
jgi:hypothetical protein